MTQYTINYCNDYCSTRNSFHNYSVDDDRSQILAWLSPLEPRVRHREIQERRVDNVGDWLIQAEEFRRWCGLGGESEGNNPVLFCYGDPGVGKTFMSSLVIDWLCDQTKGKNRLVGCFYCESSNTDFDAEAPQQQSTATILGSLLKQMISGMEKIPEEISRDFHEQKKAIGGRRPRLQDVVKMLQLITSSQDTIMCIDALDECTGVQRCKLLDSLDQILDRSPRTRIFLTGRSHIRAEVEKGLVRPVVSASISPTKSDIIRYLRARLDEDEIPDAMDESLEADILGKVLENTSEMFPLASLSIGPILQRSTIHRRREALNHMTEELKWAKIYGATIDRIWAQGWDKSRLGVEALMWISHAERPLSVEELCHALAVEIGSTYFNADNIPSISTVLSCCQGLISVDRETSTVRLINITLQKYLSSDRDVFGSYEPHSTMAEICLTYLNSAQVKAISADTSPGALDTPFLEYSSIYWGVHAKRKLSDRATSLALQLFQEYRGHVSANILEEIAHLEPPDLGTDFGSSIRFSELHCASFFGIVELVAALTEMGYYDINEGDSAGYTPLAWAAHNGHDEVVRILLEQEGVKLDEPDNNGTTPLSQAAGNGHEGVVKMLLERDEVNPHKPDNNGGTPLSHAAWAGGEGVVKLLLEREEVDPDTEDDGGRTPLSYASENGHGGVVVEILLGLRDVKPDRQDKVGATPLLYAAREGYEGVVKMLLWLEEVNPDRPDNNGGTPLSYAAWAGRGGVVKLLLEREEVDPDTEDDDGRTPISYAAENGHGGVVEMLLERGGLCRPDNAGRTPLSYAASEGHEGVVKIFLRLNISPNWVDGDGRTPLMLAENNGHKRVAEMLKAYEFLEWSG